MRRDKERDFEDETLSLSRGNSWLRAARRVASRLPQPQFRHAEFSDWANDSAASRDKEIPAHPTAATVDTETAAHRAAFGSPQPQLRRAEVSHLSSESTASHETSPDQHDSTLARASMPIQVKIKLPSHQVTPHTMREESAAREYAGSNELTPAALFAPSLASSTLLEAHAGAANSAIHRAFHSAAGAKPAPEQRADHSRNMDARSARRDSVSAGNTQEAARSGPLMSLEDYLKQRNGQER
jgi:hypothetical protein